MHSQDTPKFSARLLSFPDREAGGLIFIEQLVADSLNSCPNLRVPRLLSYNPDLGRAAVWRPACKMWNCAYCGGINRSRLRSRMSLGYEYFAKQGHLVEFLTITSHEKLGASGSERFWPGAWNRLSCRLRRKVPAVEYAFVPERHKDGRMHAHGLVTDAPGLRWWKDNARACGFGYQADRQEVESEGVAGYIAKYTGKSLQNSNFRKGFRRYRMSQGWPKLPEFEKTPGIVTLPLEKSASWGDVFKVCDPAQYDVVLEKNYDFWDWLAGEEITSETTYLEREPRP